MGRLPLHGHIFPFMGTTFFSYAHLLFQGTSSFHEHIVLYGHIFSVLNFGVMVASCPALAEYAFRLLVPERTQEVGIYGLALNPKRRKFGWLPANRQVGGKERCWPNSLGQPIQGLHPIILHHYDMPPPPHPSGVKVVPSGAGPSPVGRTRTAHSPAPCRATATSTAVHKHGKATVAPTVPHCLGNMFSLGACTAPCAAWRFAFRRQLP